LIVWLISLAQNDEQLEELCNVGWALAVSDEAHELAAHYFGSRRSKKRSVFTGPHGTLERSAALSSAR